MAALFDELRQLIGPRTLTADEVCRLLAEHYGGERLYIPRRCDRVEVSPQDTPQALVSRGVPRRTAYNWVMRWRT